MTSPRNLLLEGDVLDRLRDLPEASVQCCVTSPPYWGLRDYGTRRWFDADPGCTHQDLIEHKPHHPGQVEQTKWKSAEAAGKGQTATTHSCRQCGGWYGQLGLEPTFQGYIQHLVAVFEEVRRVLRPDGTLWLNLGDSYAGPHTEGLKPKDLIGIPWRVAFALQDAGWWLRSDVVWDKPNAMPESVRDRPTKSHEYVFLCTKSEHYYYDPDAIKEPKRVRYESSEDEARRNKRTVWPINYKPFKGAHFAVFPPGLPETCIKAGTSEKGACSECGAPWSRDGVEWKRPCSCEGELVPCLVLDPFAGSGTTLMIAKGLRRDFLGIELSEYYINLANERIGPSLELEHSKQLFDLAMDLSC